MIRAIDIPALTKQIVGAIPLRDYIATTAGIKFRRAGINHLAHCPWHEDRRPSLSVKEGSTLFYCHECKRGGNVVNFVMEYKQVSRQVALESLAKEIGAEVAIQKPDIDPTIFTAVLEFCNQTANHEALNKYLSERGVEDLTRRQAMVADGVICSLDRDGLVRHLQESGRSIAEIVKAGLDIHAMNGGVLFPVRRISGEISHFIVRPLVREGDAKYVNTGTDNDDDLFYGLHQLRVGKVILVEGVNDYYALHSAGHNVLAMNGLKLSEEQLRFLKAMDITDVTVWVDGDAPGIAFVEKVGRLQVSADKLKINLHFQYVLGMDPDDVIGTDITVLPQVACLAYMGYKFSDLKPGDKSAAYTALYEAANTFANCSRFTHNAVSLWLADHTGFLPDVMLDELTAHNTDKTVYLAERSVLSAMLRDIHDVRLRGVGVEWFGYASHKTIARGVIDNEVNMNNYRSLLPAYASVIDDMANDRGVDIENSLEVIKAEAVRRGVRAHISQPNVDAESMVSDITSLLYTVSQQSRSKNHDVYDVSKELIDDLLAKEQKMGLDLGPQFSQLNQTILGLFEGKLILIGGLTGHGKTTLALNFVQNISITNNIPGAFFSGEMDEREITSRLMTMTTAVDNTSIITHAVNDKDMEKVFGFMASLKQGSFFVETDMHFSRMLYSISHHVRHNNIKYVIVDYSELIEPTQTMRDMARYMQLREFTRRLKMEVCQRYNIPVIVLAQLNDDANDDKVQTNRNLSGAKGMANDADVTMFLRRKTDKELTLENNLGNMLLHVDKVRYRPSNTLINMQFNSMSLSLREVRKNG